MLKCYIHINIREVILMKIKRKILKWKVILLASAFILSTSFSTFAFLGEDENYRKNDYPIVLVYGFGGWGRNEAIGDLILDYEYYWGGNVDLQKELTYSGYKTLTSEVGPFSSNWDRACDLYAYIKGGTVDYGEVHSQKYGHQRYGKTYKGIYPNWGELSPDEKIQKIHLVGHSMGGPTARTLVQLLEEGSEEERIANQENISPLFQGGHCWIHSVTTIASPHDGTTMVDGRGNLLEEVVKDAIYIIAYRMNKHALDDKIIDLRLEHWGLSRKPEEKLVNYIKRVINSEIWAKTKDFSIYDLSTDGARELNKWVKTQPNVYYFSWATTATMPIPITGYHVPIPKVMNKLFYPGALIMGKYTRDEPEKVIIDESWWENDGYVNVVSQNGPKWGSNDKIIDFDGTPKKGVWNFMGKLENTDHETIIGREGDVLQFYKDLAKLLDKLPDSPY